MVTILQGFSYDKITDDRSYKNYRWSDDHLKRCSGKILTDDPTITLKMSWKFLLPTTDDPTITFRFFCRTLPMIRRSQFGFFAKRYRWSDDHNSVFLPNATDDPTITNRFFCQTLPMIRRSNVGFLSNAADDPTINIRFFCWTLPAIRR